MGRQIARWLLALAVRWAPPGSRDWAEAMLRELEFVEGDWEALCWALGGVAAMLRHVERGCLIWCGAYAEKWKEQAMEQMGKKAGLLVMGALGTIALMLAAFGLMYFTAVNFPGLGIERSERMHVLSVIVIPGLICAAVALWLWRSRRPMALGILLSLAVMGTHVAHHFAHHFGSH